MPPPVPPRIAPSLPPIAVQRVSHEADGKGVLGPNTAFVIVLNRAVEPSREAQSLALLDASGAHVPGDTVWLDRQLVAFYPHEPLAPGLDLHLVSTTPLRARDGSVLPSGELDHGSTRPIELRRARPQGGSLEIMGELALEFEAPIPAADVEARGLLTAGGKSLPFAASDSATGVLVRALGGFPPGYRPTLTWREGPVWGQRSSPLRVARHGAARVSTES